MSIEKRMVDFNLKTQTINFHGKELTLETGKLARQADGAVMVTFGKTQVLCTVCYNKNTDSAVDFLPLTVVYQEKFYSSGKIPGGYLKRESKPSDKEVLISRLIDRTIRPIFDENFNNETQVICTVMSYEECSSVDVPAMLGAMVALKISGAPINETIAGIRIGLNASGEFYVNTGNVADECENLDIFISGTKDSILMVESEIKELDEAKVLDAVEFALKNIDTLVQFANDFSNHAGQKPRFVCNTGASKELYEKISAFIIEDIKNAYGFSEKTARKTALDAASKKVKESFITPETTEVQKMQIMGIFKKIEKNFVRGKILNEGVRIDGRNTSQIRPISIEINPLKHVHGSALFTRGETQVLAVLTLGSSSDEQMFDAIGGLTKENFMLHYNFPGFSVGEVSRMMGPGRREIGHGNLARKAITSILPSKKDFPYTKRVVAEVLESNGSSSMATVCSTSLALMAAGVPTKGGVSGIAMGLIKEGEKYAVLSDILGDEDYLGDMDFKVAGTSRGITALQMDIKILGITMEILRKAIAQATDGRAYILGRMNEVISTHSLVMAETAPKIKSFTIKKDKIRSVIGQGGSVIKDICATSGATVEIEDDGTVSIFSNSQDAINKAYEMIGRHAFEVETGTIHEGKVVKVIEHGAIVEFFHGKTGMVHISELCDSRVENVADVVSEGNKVFVKVLHDDGNKIKLSMKSVDQETAKDISHMLTQKKS